MKLTFSNHRLTCQISHLSENILKILKNFDFSGFADFLKTIVNCSNSMCILPSG